MTHDAIRELLRREVDAEEYTRIRELWKKHWIAEDARDLPGLISTLTEDCVYDVVPANKQWCGHKGATQFYVELLGAFPDIHFDLTDIVIGPQGVCEEANVTGTHRGPWLGTPATGERVNFRVVIFFPWDPVKKKFKGEKVYVHPEAILTAAREHRLSVGAADV